VKHALVGWPRLRCPTSGCSGQVVFSLGDALTTARNGTPVILCATADTFQNVNNRRLVNKVISWVEGVLCVHADRICCIGFLCENTYTCCVCISPDLVKVDPANSQILLNTERICQGDWITLNCQTGEVWRAALAGDYCSDNRVTVDLSPPPLATIQAVKSYLRENVADPIAVRRARDRFGNAAVTNALDDLDGYRHRYFRVSEYELRGISKSLQEKTSRP